MLQNAPVFLVQQAFTGRDRIAPVADERVKDGRQPPGIFHNFGAVNLNGIRDANNKRGHLAPALACSARYDYTPKRGPAMAPWVQRSVPTTRPTWDATIADSLAEQRTLGLDALSVPGVEMSTSAYPNAFERQTDAVRRAWRGRQANDPPWFARFSLHDDWLTDRTMRRVALNTLTDLPDGIGISLHIRYGRRAAGFDGASLAALRDFVWVLADDGRRVLLIQSGIVGWLSLAWGAWGFTAGQSQSTWLDSREEIKRRKGSPSPPRLERYFEPQLLHHVLFSDHKRLRAQSDHTPCPCAFCKRLNSVGYTAGAAAQHDLYALAELTQRVAHTDRAVRRDAVRGIVEDAQRNWARWQTQSTGVTKRSRPLQLATWRSLV